LGDVQAREGKQPQSVAAALEESDALVVPKKSANPQVTLGESMEERSATNEEARAAKRTPDTEPDKCANAPTRVGQRAREKRDEKFTNLLSHLKAPLLREAYGCLRQQAAPGVDGETWSSYGEKLDARLLDLEGRIQRGSYHPQPVRRVHIPKGDGTTRPLGIPTLEDKIVQQAARMLMEPIYEGSAFVEFSYGFRPGRSQHDALETLARVIIRKRVNWVLDGDIRAFFDTVDHGWMKRFFEHRIGDKRFVRLLMKWLHAGVMEGTELHEVEEGTPQGGVISPLYANIYLHYVLDLWVQQWRRRHARGEVYIVRYADDFVMGFELERDAHAMRTALAARLACFGLELHTDKTRTLRFGRFAESNARLAGGGRPETFDFLGFTHISGKNREGKFQLMRRTSRKKRKAKLAALRMEMRRRRHAPVRDQHRWLASVLRGHYRYYGLPGNERALRSFRIRVSDGWERSLQRRSQRARMTVESLKRHEKRFPLPWPSTISRPPRAR
jgi:RNA-directed DNA polymerase